MEPALPETPFERAEREALERAVAHSPLRGRPLPRRARLGRPTLEGYLATVGGPLPYMARLRLIEDLTRRHEDSLRERWRELAEIEPGGKLFAEAWNTIAAAWDFFDVNGLIERHNRWYPVEARLPMDPRTGDFALVRGTRYAREPLAAAWVLERFPASSTRGAPDSNRPSRPGQWKGVATAERAATPASRDAPDRAASGIDARRGANLRSASLSRACSESVNPR